jgi:IS30 family transposase
MSSYHARQLEGPLLMMTQEEFMDVLAMKRAGMTFTEIGAQTGYHPATISKWCREGGPPAARTIE